jgi:hypothetical protein
MRREKSSTEKAGKPKALADVWSRFWQQNVGRYSLVERNRFKTHHMYLNKLST